MKHVAAMSVAALFIVEAGLFVAGCERDSTLESARAKLEARRVIVEKALQLAKDARTLDRNIRNEDYIREDMGRIKGDRKIVGWTTQFWELDGTILVEFTYERNGEMAGYPFEVNQPSGIVRNVLGDPELEKKYGWIGMTKKK